MEDIAIFAILFFGIIEILLIYAIIKALKTGKTMTVIDGSLRLFKINKSKQRKEFWIQILVELFLAAVILISIVSLLILS